MNRPAVRVDGLWKQYRIGDHSLTTELLRDAVARALVAPFRRDQERNGQPSRLIWALQDVNVSIERGEVVGIIGRNGAGKTTLLKVLSRITPPTRGRIEIDGRLASLLEVGTGFHPDLTGRENIYVNGALLGMTRREIDRKFDEIVEFAEVEEFIDTPIKRYSSGMAIRLAFSVAAHLDAEILVVDEVLAVGDASFQEKCLGKMRSVAGDGRTVLFVSHNMAPVETLCSRAIMMSAGRVAAVGPTRDVVSTYVDSLRRGRQSRAETRHLVGADSARCRWLTNVVLLSAAGERETMFRIGEPIVIAVRIAGECPLRSPRLTIGIDDEYRRRVFTVGTEFDADLRWEVRGECEIACEIDVPPLAPGGYSVATALFGAQGLVDHIDYAGEFRVAESDYFGTGKLPRKDQGPLLCRAKWRVTASQ